MKRQIIISSLILAATSVTIISCDKKNTPAPGQKDPVVYQQCAPDRDLSTTISFNGKSFNLNKFEEKLHSALDGKCVGYQYSISQDNVILRSKGYGYARIPAEGGDLMSPCSRMNIASVSKTITAVAMLQVLEANQIQVDDFIAPYLPANWVKGSGVNQVTFRQLLSHNSGFRSADNMGFDTLLYSRLRNMVALGTGAGNGYLNANLALCRILIPAILNPDTSALTETYCNTEYKKYVNKYVLNPCGIEDGQFSTIPGQFPVFMYRYNGAVVGSGYNSDADGWFARCGGGGWFLSAIDLNKFLNGIRYNDAVLSPANRLIMQTQVATTGFAPGTIHFHSAFNGTAYGHNGGIGYGGGQGFTTIIYQFPQNINAVLMINCLSDGTATTRVPFAQPTLLSAFNEAWE